MPTKRKPFVPTKISPKTQKLRFFKSPEMHSAVSRTFFSFARNNPGLTKKALSLVNEVISLKRKIPYKDTKNGLFISGKTTGKFKGRKGGFSLRVQIKDKVFFVRAREKEPGWYFDNKDIIKTHENAARYLESIGNKIGPYSVFVLQPHFVRLTPKPTLFVTDFLDARQVTQVHDLPEKQRNEIDGQVALLAKELWYHDVKESHIGNQFFDKKTNTIYLFDLEPREMADDL